MVVLDGKGCRLEPPDGFTSILSAPSTAVLEYYQDLLKATTSSVVLNKTPMIEWENGYTIELNYSSNIVLDHKSTA
ncbi:hypothetical protein DPMN_164536 [Dreissena polymorpha]|uniref:Uncharacterized protein n=1 Tax=Dreissena polymorpha TaxID=45954 RepID=A0A9D4ET48_DREPO|nr:hypothetical protein DPMN_164536 [Dreissena polymorpha]